MCSSKWDGVYEPVTEAKTPVYFVIGEIDNLLVLDIKEKNYFAGTKVTYQHGGGYLFCRDEKIMGWLFGH